MSLLTLDDAAIQLQQLDATDLDELTPLYDALTTLVVGGGVPAAAQPLAARAARLLGTLVRGTAEGPALVFTDARRSLDAAVALVTSADRVASDDQLPEDTDYELLGEFLAEGMECLTRAESGLLTLEAQPTDEAAINAVFRAFHTVKGTSAFLGLERITDFAHEAESLLSRVRDGEVAYTRECAELALSSSDMLRALLRVAQNHSATSGELPVPTGYAQLLKALSSFDAPAVTLVAANALPTVAVRDQATPVVRREVPPATSASRGADAGVPARQDHGGDGTVRVRTDQLNRLIDTVGALAIAHATFAEDAQLEVAKHPALAGKFAAADTLVQALQQLSLSMRMVALRPTFQKLTRVVRDTAVRADKQVRFAVTGEDVEIDRQVADLLGDPLVHMVRNAIDHGIEHTEERLRAGKPSAGTLRLSACHAADHVVIELVDDGRGLHRDRIVAKARERGLITSDQGMTDSEVFRLILAPGFSTAERVTSISGRGVGMDVVRQNLEDMRGRIEIASTEGLGTTFALRIPTTPPSDIGPRSLTQAPYAA